MLCIGGFKWNYSIDSALMSSIDYLVLSKNARVDLIKLSQELKIGKVIFDSSNSKYKVALWKEQCKSAKLAYYDVSSSGAFVENL